MVHLSVHISYSQLNTTPMLNSVLKPHVEAQLQTQHCTHLAKSLSLHGSKPWSKPSSKNFKVSSLLLHAGVNWCSANLHTSKFRMVILAYSLQRTAISELQSSARKCRKCWMWEMLDAIRTCLSKRSRQSPATVRAVMRKLSSLTAPNDATFSTVMLSRCVVRNHAVQVLHPFKFWVCKLASQSKIYELHTKGLYCYGIRTGLFGRALPRHSSRMQQTCSEG